MHRFLVSALMISCAVRVASAQDSLAGAWTAKQTDDGYWVSFSADDYGWHTSKVFRLPDLPPGEVEITIDRDPGSITLEGRHRGDRAAGFFVFRPSLTFNDRIAQLGYGPFDFHQLYLLTAVDARVAEMARLHNLGYTDLTTDELLSMHIHGALSDHIEAMRRIGYGNLSVDDLLSTRIHDVTPEYVRSIRELGYPNVTVDDLIGMRIHDVTPEYVRAVNEKLDPERQ